MGRLAVLAAVALVALTFPTAPAQAATVDVSIQNHAFSPGKLTVLAGDTVRWTNKDSVAHTVTSSGRTRRAATTERWLAHSPGDAGAVEVARIRRRQSLDAPALLRASASPRERGTPSCRLVVACRRRIS